MVATRLTCASSICISRNRRSLVRASASSEQRDRGPDPAIPRLLRIGQMRDLTPPQIHFYRRRLRAERFVIRRYLHAKKPQSLDCHGERIVIFTGDLVHFQTQLIHRSLVEIAFRADQEGFEQALRRFESAMQILVLRPMFPV
jgi:hypothetical protein